MTRLEKCLLAKEKGYTYDVISGKVYKINGKEAKSVKRDGYLRINMNKAGMQYHLTQHQYAWYCIHNEIVDCIDHINGIRDDNRIENLRKVTQQQNTFNKTKSKGYTWHKGVKKWMAQIMLNKKTIYLGYFNTEEDAHEAYESAKKVYHVIE